MQFLPFKNFINLSLKAIFKNLQKLVTENFIILKLMWTETQKVACSFPTQKVNSGWDLDAILCACRKRTIQRNCEELTVVQHFTLSSGLGPSITLRFSFTFRFLLLGIKRSSGGDPGVGRPSRNLIGILVGGESTFNSCLDSTH